MPTVVIDRRFRGPPASANGGYACGVVAGGIAKAAGAIEATLRSPPPLGVPMELRASGGAAELLNGPDLVATARAADPPSLEIPEPPAFDAAVAAGAGCPWRTRHPYPPCFTCGPDRAPPDALHLLTGPLDGRDVIADGWIPHPRDAAPDGAVDERIVWAALDCPTGNAALYFHPPENLVLLGRLTTELREPVLAGERHVVIGWPLDREGRKHWGASAIIGADGTVCGTALGLWIELRPGAS
jgi:hypothetical protein